MKWTNELIEKVEKFIEIKNKGYYADGRQVTDAYNEVLEKKLPPTNCSSCIRSRITELEKALNRFKKQMELSGFTNTSQLVEEIKAIEGEIQPSETVKEAEPTTVKATKNKSVRKRK